ncbi:hypothetical protein ACFQ12_16655 [Methylobacterium trifolii]
MIASTMLEVLLIGLAVWQLIVVRKSIRAARTPRNTSSVRGCIVIP